MFASRAESKRERESSPVLGTHGSHGSQNSDTTNKRRKMEPDTIPNWAQDDGRKPLFLGVSPDEAVSMLVGLLLHAIPGSPLYLRAIDDLMDHRLLLHLGAEPMRTVADICIIRNINGSTLNPAKAAQVLCDIHVAWRKNATGRLSQMITTPNMLSIVLADLFEGVRHRLQIPSHISEALHAIMRGLNVSEGSFPPAAETPDVPPNRSEARLSMSPPGLSTMPISTQVSINIRNKTRNIKPTDVLDMSRDVFGRLGRVLVVTRISQKTWAVTFEESRAAQAAIGMRFHFRGERITVRPLELYTPPGSPPKSTTFPRPGDAGGSLALRLPPARDIPRLDTPRSEISRLNLASSSDSPRLFYAVIPTTVPNFRSEDVVHEIARTFPNSHFSLLAQRRPLANPHVPRCKTGTEHTKWILAIDRASHLRTFKITFAAEGGNYTVTFVTVELGRYCCVCHDDNGHAPTECPFVVPFRGSEGPRLRQGDGRSV